MRRAAVMFLPALAAAAGCALVGYDFDGYGPEAASSSGAGASASGSGAAGPGASSGSGSGSGPGASSGSGVSACAAPAFQARIDVKVVAPPFALRAADMDGDLKPDVVMTNPKANR